MRTPDQTKDLIISEAISIFNTKGYRATSLSDITKATGITKGAIYGHFANKEEVAIAGFEYATRIIVSQIQEVIQGAPKAPEKLIAIANYYSDYIMNPPIKGGCPIINTSIEADDDHAHLRTKVVRFIGVMKDSLQKIIYRGIKEGQIKEDANAEEFSVLFYAAIEGGIVMSRIEGDNRTYEIIRKKLLKDIEEISL